MIHPRHLNATGFLLVALVASALPSRATAQRIDRAEVTAAVDSVVAAARARDKIVGMTVLVAQSAQPLLLKGYGLANLDYDIPAGPETVYGIGSLTKQFIAAAILCLADEGKLRLDDKLSAYFPAFPAAAGVTLRHLLTNTSGINGTTRLSGRNPERVDHSRDEIMELLFAANRDSAPEFAPGDAWSYQSVNYALLGFVIAKVTGTNLWDFLRERFFTPLGMNATGVCDPTAVVKHRATGYVADTGKPDGIAVAPFVSASYWLGNSGMCSSAPDLLKWQRGLVEHRVMSAESYARMTEPVSLNDGRRTDYAYGVVRWRLGEEDMIFHTGAAPGFTAYLTYLPASDITVAVLINSRSDIFALGPKLARAVRGIPQPQDLGTTARERARYTGAYESGRVKLDVIEEDGVLRADVTNSDSFRFVFPPALVRQAEHEFVMDWEPTSRLTFIMKGGRAAAAVLRYGDRTLQLRRR